MLLYNSRYLTLSNRPRLSEAPLDYCEAILRRSSGSRLSNIAPALHVETTLHCNDIDHSAGFNTEGTQPPEVHSPDRPDLQERVVASKPATNSQIRYIQYLIFNRSLGFIIKRTTPLHALRRTPRYHPLLTMSNPNVLSPTSSSSGTSRRTSSSPIHSAAVSPSTERFAPKPQTEPPPLPSFLRETLSGRYSCNKRFPSCELTDP